jgi:hypothetical protein
VCELEIDEPEYIVIILGLPGTKFPLAPTDNAP